MNSLPHPPPVRLVRVISPCQTPVREPSEGADPVVEPLDEHATKPVIIRTMKAEPVTARYICDSISIRTLPLGEVFIIRRCLFVRGQSRWMPRGSTMDGTALSS